MRKDYFLSLRNKGDLLYIVALSGGPDSTFLLYKMYSLGHRIVAAHVNYGKRHDSFYDEELVTKHCKELSIRLFIERANDYKKGNFQAAARDLRYKFFSQVAEKLSSEGFKIGGIVVAHNFEDLLETYWLQRERKSLVNYWGLPAQSQLGKWFIFRPIISFRKNSIVKILTQEGIKYSVDYTNDSTVYRRNVIRKEIFMLSEETKSLLSKQIGEENFLLLKNIKEVNQKVRILLSGNVFNIEDEEWLLSGTEIKQRIIYTLLNSFSEGKFFSRKKKVVVEVCKQLQSRKEKFTINIGNELTIFKLKKVVIFVKGEKYQRLL